MARFTVGPGFFADFDATPIATADGEITVADSHLIRIRVDHVEDGFENFIGDFEYVDGLPIGTVREYLLTSDNNPVYRISSADIDVLELRRIEDSMILRSSWSISSAPTIVSWAKVSMMKWQGMRAMTF